MLALFWSSFLLWKNIKLTSYNEESLFDGMFMSILGGLFFGRLIFTLLHFSDFKFSILRFILVNGYPGFNTLGIVCGGLFTFYVFTIIKKIPFRKVVDYIIPSLLLSLAILKLGSFFAGVDIGIQTSFYLSLKYPNFDGTRHLVALYESVGYFLLTFLTQKTLFAIRREKYYSGFNLVLFFFSLSLITTTFDWMKEFTFRISTVTLDTILMAPVVLTLVVYLVYYFRVDIVSNIKRISTRKRSKTS